MPIYSPTGFLDITNATLRTSNVEAENLLMTGGNIYVTSELETDATVLNLENVTRKGNVSSNTIEITNVTTGIIATGNVHASKFIGSGSHLTGIPPSAITGTLSQWSDGTNGDVYIAGNVGIANAHTLTSNTLQVGGNLYVRDTGSNVLTVNGNVVANYFEGDGSKLSGIVTDLQGVTDNGNVTTNVVQFSNVTTGLVTTANIEVGGDLKIDGLTAGKIPYVAADKFLKDSFITTTGDATVISSNLDVTGNIFMRGEKFIIESETKLINDAIIGIANNNTSSTTDKGIIMQNTAGNVAIIHHGTGDGFANQLTLGYTDDPLDTITVTNDLTKELTVNIIGNVITQNNLSVGGTLKINNITAAAQHSLQAVTNVGNVTSNTVQFSNAITSLTASSNIVVTGNVSAGHDTNTTSYFGRAAVGYMGQDDQASFAHVDHNDPARYAIKQTAAGPTYINTPAAGHIRFTVNDGNAGAEKMRITSAGKVGVGVTSPDATLHVVGNAYVSSNLTVSGNVEVGTANLFVDTVNSRVGIGIASPLSRLHVGDGSNPPADTVDADASLTLDGAGRKKVEQGKPGIYHRENVGLGLHSDYKMSFEVGGGSTLVEAMRILDNGNVGIGTTSAEAPFSVIGNNALSGTPNNAIATFRATTANPGTNDAGVVIGSINGNAPYIADVSTASLGLSFYTQSVQRMKILPGSNTGIEIYANGPVINCVNNNPGDMISKRYASADRYGMGQYAGGITRLFTSTAYGSAKIALSGANDDVTDTNAGFNDYLTVENEGYIKYHNQPRFSAYSNNGNTAYSGFSQPVVMNSTYYNVGSHYNASTGLFTAPITGHYRFSVVVYNNTGGESQFSMWYRSSSSGTLDDICPYKLLGTTAAGDETIWDVDNGDAVGCTFDLYVPQNYQIGWGGRGAAAVTVYRAHSYFSGELISIA